MLESIKVDNDDNVIPLTTKSYKRSTLEEKCAWFTGNELVKKFPASHLKRLKKLFDSKSKKIFYAFIQ